MASPILGILNTQQAGRAFSQVLGWTSTIAWSISFYPQVILNYKRKSIQGLSLDFVYLNVQGFLAYSVYNVALVASSSIRESYRQRHHGYAPSVRGNDVAFAVHVGHPRLDFTSVSVLMLQQALALSLVTLWQTFHYDPERKRQLSAFSSFFIAITSLLIAICAVVATFGGLAWLDVLYVMSYVKIVISFLKLMPQAWMNFKRKSTTGWSIYNILLDFTGGVCSLAQLLLDAHLTRDWGSLRGNPAKLVLGILAPTFDVLFIVQHCILYRHPDVTGGASHQGATEEHAPQVVEDDEPSESTPLV